MKKIIGYILLAISTLAWTLILVIPFFGFAGSEVAAGITGLIITGEVSFFAGLALLGKQAWEQIKSYIAKLFKKETIPVDSNQK